MLKPLFILLALATLLAASPPVFKSSNPLPGKGDLQITFKNVVNKEPMILGKKNYTNPFEEGYSINKFKYYVSNILLTSAAYSFAENNSYHLINQEDTASLTFSLALPAGKYSALKFLLGVDSLHNVSGAQTGALDPANNMFWIWSSGYIMAKMEGTSPSSPLDNKFEFHLGGYSGVNSVLKYIQFKLPPPALIIHEGKISEIIIEADADAWWQHPNNITISAMPNITSPGLPAKKLSENYSKMFTIKQIINN